MLFLKRNLNFNQLYKCDISEELIGPGDYYYEDDQDGFIVKAEVYKELKNRKKEEEWDYSILNQAENELEYKRMLKETTMNMLASTLFERKVFNKLEPVEESETIKELYEEANKNNKEDK